MKKPTRRRRGADVVLPEAVVEHLDKMADDLVKTAALPPLGYSRHNIRMMLHAIGRRSLADTGPDFPTAVFGES